MASSNFSNKYDEHIYYSKLEGEYGTKLEMCKKFLADAESALDFFNNDVANNITDACLEFNGRY